MSDIHTGTSSARSTSHHDFYDVMRNLYRKYPKLEPRKVILKWRNIVRDDPDMNNAALELAGLYVYNGVLPGPKKKKQPTKVALEEQYRRQIKRSIFNFVMPNGKRLGKCTGSEVAKCGKGFEKLSRMIGPKEIVEETITQAQAKKVVLG